MTEHTKQDPQLDMFPQVANDDTYTAYTLAEEYGLSDGQARSLIKIYGASREVLDKVIAAQTYP